VRVLDQGPREAFRLPDPAASGTPPAATPAASPGSAAMPAASPGSDPVASVAPRAPSPPAGREAKHQIAVTDIRLNRLAQLPTEWPRKDFVANTLEVDLEARTLPCTAGNTGAPDPERGARIHLTGELHNYWDRPYDGSWNLALEAKNLGPT